MADEKILIVEDERITAQDIRLRLEDLGYSVCAMARSGEDAIEKARTHRPDMVIMDILLDGGMTGVEAADRIYRELNVPVVYLTSHSDEQTVNQASRTNAFGYLIKPVRDVELKTTLEIALSKFETEKRIRASEENYRVLVEGLGQAILKIGSDGKLLFVNRAAADWLGKSQAALTGRILREALPQTVAGRVAKLCSRVLGDRAPVMEDMQWDSDRGRRWLDLALYPLKERADQADSVLVIARDVTREREIQKALETAESRFEKLYNEMPVGIYQSAPDGRILQANQSLVRMLGFESLEELQNRSRNNGHIDSREHDLFLQRIREEGVITGFEAQWKRKDGTPVWVHETARAYKDPGGEILFIEGIAEDITERKAAEAEIQYRLNFEEAVSHIASKFVQAQDIEESIRQSLQNLGQLSGADRVYFGQFNGETPRMDAFIHWCRKGVPSHRRKYAALSFDRYPWWHERLREKQIVNLGDIREIPEEASAERAFLEQIGVRSQLLMPVHFGGRLAGFIGFDNVKQTISWRMVDIALIQIFADILSSALERRAMVESLQFSEEKFRNIFLRSAVGIGLANANGQYFEANEALLRIYGFDSIDTLNAHAHLTTLSEEDFNNNLAEAANAFSCEKEFDFHALHAAGRYSGRHRDSRIFYVIITSLQPFGHRKPERFLVQVNDITVQKKADEAIRKERDLLQALIETIPDTVYFKDTESRFTRINPAQARLLGVEDPAEAIGKTDFDFFRPEEAREMHADEQKLLKTREPIISKMEEVRNPDGSTLWLTATKVPLFDHENRVTGLMGISRNVTEIKHTEEKLAQAAEALAQSNKELLQFAYVASHDLQEPLRTVASYVQLLQKRYENRLDEDADTFIRYAVDGVSRMQRLIRDLLLYSRVDTRGKPFEETRLNEVLDVVRMNMKFTIEDHGARIQSDELPVVCADEGQLVQLFQNLISNAIKFRGEKKPVIRIRSRRCDTHWRISVKDNGIGIPPDQLENIFMIFKRLHPQDKYDGTGIGLAVCKKIVERHGGAIQVESALAKGSTFTFTIPVKNERIP